MATFPTLPIEEIKRKTIKPAIRSSFESGYEQTRPKYTRTIKEFSLTFTALTHAEAKILDDFFIENQGLTFSFYDKTLDSTHTVRFSDDELSFTQLFTKYQSTSCVLKEV